MNKNYDCRNCARQPEAEANAQMEKLIFNKEKFLETDFGEKLIDCAVDLDSVLVSAFKYHMDLDARMKMQRQTDLRLAQWEVYQAAMRQFYGLHLHFTRTDEYFGVCSKDKSFWLFKVERGAENVQTEN